MIISAGPSDKDIVDGTLKMICHLKLHCQPLFECLAGLPETNATCYCYCAFTMFSVYRGIFITDHF